MFHTTGQHDIKALDSTSTERDVVNTPLTEVQGQLAPGRRLAYTAADPSGTLNVYVRTLDGKTAAIQVSADGGFDPHWRGDGRELFFLDLDRYMHAVEVHGEHLLKPGPRRPLFQTQVPPPSRPYLSNFDVTKDGGRFLVNVPLQAPGSRPITLTQEWTKRVN